MTFVVKIEGNEIPNESLIYRDMGFGKSVSLPSKEFLIEASLDYAIDLIRDDMNEFIQDCRIDDENGEVELAELRAASYPPPIILVTEHPELFCQIIKEYLYFNMLGKLLDNNPRGVWKYAVNSIDSVFINSGNFCISGQTYELADRAV